MASAMSALTGALAAHLRTDPAFSRVQVVREQPPRREHLTVDLGAWVEYGGRRPSGSVSFGEYSKTYPLTVTFGLQLQDDEQGNISDILNDLGEALSADLDAKSNPLSLAALPAGKSYQRLRVLGFIVNPPPFTESPKSHGLQVPIEVDLCERR